MRPRAGGPGPWEDADGRWPTDADIDRLIASAPDFADWPLDDGRDYRAPGGGAPVGGGSGGSRRVREATAAELAALSTNPNISFHGGAPVPAEDPEPDTAPVPAEDPESETAPAPVSEGTGGEVAGVRAGWLAAVRDSVPDLVLAPRPRRRNDFGVLEERVSSDWLEHRRSTHQPGTGTNAQPGTGTNAQPGGESGPESGGRGATGPGALPVGLPGSLPVPGTGGVPGSLPVPEAGSVPGVVAGLLAAEAGWSPVVVAEALAGLDPESVGDNDVLDMVHAATRLASFAQAVEARALAVFASRRPPVADEACAGEADGGPGRSMWAAGEVMAVAAIPQGAAEQRLHDAERLLGHLPGTYALFRAGLLDLVRIQAIHRGLLNVPDTVLPLIEPLFLKNASRTPPSILTRRVRMLAEKHNPESLTVRHERARKGRGVFLRPLPDAMAELIMVLPAVPALSVYQSVDAWARAAQLAGEPSGGTTPTGRAARSLNEYRADALTDLLHQALLHPAGTCTNCNCNCNCNNGCGTTTGNTGGNSDGSTGGTSDGSANKGSANSDGSGTGSADTTGITGNGTNKGNTGKGTSGGGAGAGSRFRARVPARINIHLTAATATGASEDPGYLDGYGHIPAGQARELAGESDSWYKFLTDPVTGTVTDIGRRSYQPPEDMKRLVRAKSPTCTGIGCDRDAASCELDHTIPFHMNRYGPDGTPLPKGTTSVENLRPRSKYCHMLKDNPNTGWTVEPAGPGTTKTTTPTGRIYLTTQNDDPPPF